jgi:uncharacterized repeat protein (TIGR03803 family)
MRPKPSCSGANGFLIVLLVTLVPTIPVWAAHEKILHDVVAFPHGANPQANLTDDAAGNLYGTTPYGGAYGYGTVFKIAPSKNNNWNQTVLYNFTGGSDGANPVAGLIVDKAGNLYGTTAAGGILEQQCHYSSFTANSCGVVFELSPGAHGSWTQSVLHSFTGYPNDGQTPIASLTFDSSGNLYGTTDGGGAYTAGTVFELSPSTNSVWTETILYDFSGGADGSGPAANLIFDSVGNIYGTTEFGGDFNCNPQSYPTSCGTVFQLAPDGRGSWSETVLHTFIYNDGAYPLSSLVFDSAGNLYGTTPTGPGFACNQSGCGTVFRLEPNSDGTWTQTIIYNFEGELDGADPVAGLVIDGSGNLYGTTAMGGFSGCYDNCGTVFELIRTSKGNWFETVIDRLGSGSVVRANMGSLPMSALLLDRQGNIYGTASSGGGFGGLCGDSSIGLCGTVFKLAQTSHGWETRLVYRFPPGIEGIGPRAGLISDAAGNLYGITGTGGENNCSSGGDGANGCGTVFELQPRISGGWKDIVLHTFNGLIDGAGPAASLISDTFGNLYGTTSNGGSAACIGRDAPCGGTVFKLSFTAAGWKTTVLHTFHVKAGTQNGDGARPLSGLVMDSTGNLYGTTSLGGSHSSTCTLDQYIGCGTAFKLSPTSTGKWKEDLLYIFQGGVDGAGPMSTLVLDGAGNLYGTTCGGGANSNGTVFRLAPGSDGKWIESVLYSFQVSGSGDGNCPMAGVIFDRDGNLFGTTFSGGNYTGNCSNGGCGVVYELSAGGTGVWKETVLLAFRGTDGSNPDGALTFDSGGNLYGAARYNGINFSFVSGVVFQLSPGSKGWTEHVLHRFGKGFDGSGPNGGLIFDSAGNIYGTTSGGGTDVFPTDTGGTVFELFAGLGGEWVESLASPPPHPPGFGSPYFQPFTAHEMAVGVSRKGGKR